MKPINSKIFPAIVLMCSGCAGLLGLTPGDACGQQPIRHELIRGDMPPGVAADLYRMSNRSLSGHVQPVQVMVPDQCVIAVGGGGGFSNDSSESVSVGMMIGPVYRFKISNLPMVEHRDKELYPSIEVINRLHPPEGLENEFPIQVVISRDDLKQAAEGRMVTKVIYLEDPRGTMPNKHQQGQQPSFDVGGGEDPLRAAEQLGRPMAILRMGSRVPMPTDPAERFDFGSPFPQLLPRPQSEGVVFDKQYMERIQNNPSAALEYNEPRQMIVTPLQAEVQPIGTSRLESDTAGSAVKSTPVMISPRQPLANPAQPVPLSRSDFVEPQRTGLRVAPRTQSSQRQLMDPVARAARAQYEAAVAEMQAPNQIRQTSAMTNPSSGVTVIAPPAPVVKSDIEPALIPMQAPSTKAQPLTPRRPDQIKLF